MTSLFLAEHFFRHEYARLVAVLARRVGLQHLDAVEDAVQAALLAALETWTRSGTPDEPTAWLYRVAHNQLIGELRQTARRRALDQLWGAGADDLVGEAPEHVLLADVQDDLLRMLFACCDESIPLQSQVVFALKTLCGFEVREIAQRLFASEAAIYKRLSRARDELGAHATAFDAWGPELISSRLPAVHCVLYLMFTEGHLSSHPQLPVRRELCGEAKRLTLLLAEHPLGGTPETFALMALMHLHAARMASRQLDGDALLLLDEQDRSLWDRDEIGSGLSWLARSASGSRLSRFHAEAGIAAEHCLAPSVAATRWDRIVECYELLEHFAPSPLHSLGKALAVAELKDPARGLAVRDGLRPPAEVADSFQWHAALAEMHRRCGHVDSAQHHGDKALSLAPSHAIASAMRRRMLGAADRFTPN